MSFFFFKQKTAYEMRISDWSSDVCSSDLLIFTILPVVSARSDHITVDLLVLPRSSMLRRIQNLAINVTSAIMLAVLAWQLWLHAADMYSYNAISPFLSIPMAPVATLMAAMAGTTAAVLLCLALRALLPPWPSAGT